MPDIGVYHPQIVHFVIALGIVGVVFRLAALTGKLAMLRPAATILILAAAVASVLAVRSGLDAHETAERIPGIRSAVVEHEDWGEATRNILLGVAALELLGWVLRKQRYHGLIFAASGLVGLWACYAIYQTGRLGGDLVYAYAGGVGTRSGQPEDVSRLFLAGLYQEAMLDRQQGKAVEAADLIAQLARRFPADTNIQLLAAESLVWDRKDGKAALAALARLTPPTGDRRMRLRVGMLAADAWEAAGRADSARAVLQRLIAEYPDFQRLKDRLAQVR